MPKNKKKTNDDRMIDDYFKHLNNYQTRFGEKTLLLWQCGSFYEVYTMLDENNEYLNTYFQDYVDITNMNVANKHLFATKNNKKYPVYMAGFTAQDCYLEKWVTVLTKHGYTVPIWQEKGTSTPRMRCEVGIYSPACVPITTKKQEDTNNSACYIIHKSTGFLKKNPTLVIGCSVIDMFTGIVKVFQYTISAPDVHNPTIFNELERFNAIYKPSEIVLIHNYKDENLIKDIIQFTGLHPKALHKINLNNDTEQSKEAHNCDTQVYQKEIIEKFYPDINDYQVYLESSGFSTQPTALSSLCFLLNFMWVHNANLTHKLIKPSFENVCDSLHLGNHSLRQLNIVNVDHKGAYSSVESIVNKCVTPMGRRYLKDKLLHPVTNMNYLNEQYTLTDYLIENWDKYNFLRKSFQSIKDIEYLYRKIIFNKITPLELYSFNKNLHCIKEIHTKIKNDKVLMTYIKNNIGTNIESVCDQLICFLERNLNMDVCSTLFDNKFEVNFMNSNINEVLDEVSQEYDDTLLEKQKWIRVLTKLIGTKAKAIKTPIKIHMTGKGGIYFYATSSRCGFITKSIMELIKQKKTDIFEGLDFSTFKHSSGGISGNHKLGGSVLTNFYKKYGQKLDNLQEILENVYTEFVISLREYNSQLNDFVKYVSDLDMLTTKAFVSINNNYCRPTIKKSKKSYIIAKNIRHPIIEKVQHNETYVPNDVTIGKEHNGMLIFGTNGVGKSSINRSVGVSLIMAQAGMFVPCSYFEYSPYTAIYTRILGNDNIFKGLSTFTVEMSEVANFINNCDENSLILGDEVCSGTETSSAVSIFAEVLLWLNKTKSSHIFATHFHQLTTMNEITKLKKLAIKHMSVKNINGVLHYTRKLEDGPGENMYGIEVCKSFPFPDEFINGTYKLRNKYNKKLIGTLKKKKTSYSKKKLKGDCEFCEQTGVDIHHLTPQEMADTNGYFKDTGFHKNHPANLTNICKDCHNNFTKNKVIHRKTKTTEGYKLTVQ